MRFVTAAVSIVIGTKAWADVPQVVTDIAPVHSIVSAVMGDIGKPVLIVPPGASPHDHSLRPSDARTLDQADIVIWLGGGLTPWMNTSLEALADDSLQVVLLDQPGTELLPMRTNGVFGKEDGEESSDHDEEHSDHDHETADGMDPHAWLDPDNASVWAKAVAEVLAVADAENAAEFRNNARLFQRRMEALSSEIDRMLEPVRGRPFVVFHDAYHYFEHRFGMEAIGAITDTDAVDASPARIAGLREEVEQTGAVCVLTEPQFNPGLGKTIGAAMLGEIDPIGATIEPGPDLYPELLRNMSSVLVDCLN